MDPTVIADIGRNGIDVAGSQAKALTLSDLYRRERLGQGAEKAAAREQEEMTYARDVLSNADLSSTEGQNAAVAQITKRNPQLGMKLMRDFQADRKGQAELSEAQLKLYGAKNEVLGGALVGLKTTHDDLARAGKNPEEINAAMMPQVVQTVQQLVGAKLPDGSPLLNDQDRQWIQQNLGQGYNTQAVDGLVARSKEAGEVLKSKMEERKFALDERRVTNSERNTTALIADRERRATAGALGEEDLDFMAAQFLASGDRSIFQNLGRGAQGAENIVQLRRRIRQQAEDGGLSPADVATKVAEFNQISAMQRSLGTRLANIQTAAEEAAQMIPIARAANQAVSRSGFKPWNSLVKGENIVTQDPAYAEFAAATLAVVNTWARAISPSGVPTVADKEHANEVLSTVQSQEAYNAVLNQFDKEIQAALASPEHVSSRIRDRIKASALGTRNDADKKSTAGADTSHGTPPPAAGKAPAGGPPPPPPGFTIQK